MNDSLHNAFRPLWFAAVMWVVAAFAASGGAYAQSNAIQFERSELTVVSARGRFRFDVELANTEEQREQGLQNRPAMPVSSGMLFDFKAPRVIVMWMKNTLISLDMLFIAPDGTVVTIAENTQPLSLAAISSRVPVLGVLEVNAGTVRRLGLREGDRVVHPIFGG
jgi:uncharacterized membrane protein (UPF0127 family)